MQPDDLFAAVPHHPLSERPEEASSRYARQVRRHRRDLGTLDARLLTTGLNAAALLPGGTWLPFPVALPPVLARESATAVRVLLAPGSRSQREVAVIESLAEVFGPGRSLSVTRLDDRAAADATVLAGHHVLVDALSLGEHSNLAARALAHGLVVLTGVRSHLAEGVLAAHLADLGLPPDTLEQVLVSTRPADLRHVLLDVIAALEGESADGSTHTADLARHVASALHGPRSARLVIERALGPTSD